MMKPLYPPKRLTRKELQVESYPDLLHAKRAGKPLRKLMVEAGQRWRLAAPPAGAHVASRLRCDMYRRVSNADVAMHAAYKYLEWQMDEPEDEAKALQAELERFLDIYWKAPQA